MTRQSSYLQQAFVLERKSNYRWIIRFLIPIGVMKKIKWGK